MSEIKPVAWTSITQLEAVRLTGDGIMAFADNLSWSIPLYDQSAIDRLTEERDFARKEAQFLRSHRPIARRLTEVEEERDAAFADADRYRKIEALAAGTPEQWQAVEDAAFASHWGCIQNFAINIDAIADMKEQEQGK